MKKAFVALLLILAIAYAQEQENVVGQEAAVGEELPSVVGCADYSKPRKGCYPGYTMRGTSTMRGLTEAQCCKKCTDNPSCKSYEFAYYGRRTYCQIQSFDDASKGGRRWISRCGNWYYMEKVKRDGSWNAWGAWGGCSKTCGGGTKSRSRSCRPGAHGGRPCSGPSTSSTSCATNPCACYSSGRKGCYPGYVIKGTGSPRVPGLVACKKRCSDRSDCKSCEYSGGSNGRCQVQSFNDATRGSRRWSSRCGSWMYYEKKDCHPKGRKGCYPGYVIKGTGSPRVPGLAACQKRCDDRYDCLSCEYSGGSNGRCQIQSFNDATRGSRRWTSHCGSWMYYEKRSLTEEVVDDDDEQAQFIQAEEEDESSTLGFAYGYNDEVTSTTYAYGGAAILSVVGVGAFFIKRRKSTAAEYSALLTEEQ